MPRYINADDLLKVKFHPLPYTHIVPADLIGQMSEAYERGWNDAIDAIVENAETVERKTGKWEKKWHSLLKEELPCCSECHHFSRMRWYYCPWCGAEMEREAEDGGSD